MPVSRDPLHGKLGASNAAGFHRCLHQTLTKRFSGMNQPTAFQPERRIPFISTIIGLLLAAFAMPAAAALGGSAASVNADVDTLSGVLMSSSEQAGYTVESVALPGNVVVKEYLNASGGQVFAISWRGLRPPDLSSLLGSYYAEYQAGLDARQSSQTRATRGRMTMKTQNLMVETGGHMRDLRGAIYLPAQIPAGLTAGELQ